jgi:hypothetical protein
MEPGTKAVLWGVHSSQRVPCADPDCPHEHWERPVTGTNYEDNYHGSFRYHREGERTAVPIVVVGEEVRQAAVVYWDEVGILTEEGAQELAETEQVPLRQRTSDGVWEKMRVVSYDIPGAKPKLRVIDGHGAELSVDYDDVEEVE